MKQPMQASPDLTKTRGRPKCLPDERQCHLIISCARRLFVEKGYGATKTEDIAVECKISKQTLYRLFPGKAALFTAVVKAHRQRWLDLPREDDDLPLEETLAKIFMVDISEQADQERTDVLRLVLSEGRNFPELSEILKQQSIDFSRRQLAEWLERQAARGRLNLTDPKDAAQILLDMMFGTIVVKNVGGLEWLGGEQRRAHFLNCIGIFLHGVCASGRA